MASLFEAGLASQMNLKSGRIGAKSLPDVDEALDGQRSSSSWKVPTMEAPGVDDSEFPPCPWVMDKMMVKFWAKVIKSDKEEGTRYHRALLLFVPDSRKCKTCRFKASDTNPLCETEPLFWGYPSRYAKRESCYSTDGWECGCCMKIFNSKHRSMFVTVKAWQEDMGTSVTKADDHQKDVDACVKLWQKTGYELPRIDWAWVSNYVMTMSKKQLLDVERPGLSFAPWYHYVTRINTSGVLRPGESRG